MYYDNEDYMVREEIIRSLASKRIRLFAKNLFGPLLAKVFIVAGAVFVVFFLFIMAYAAIFLVPQQIAQETLGRVKAFFNLGDLKATAWTEEDDQALYDEYTRLTESWKEGLDAYQQEQAQDYALSWGVLAAVDRVFGDPIINEEIKGERDYKPNPEKIYKILRPIFEWKDSTIIRELEWEEEVEVGSDRNGNPIYQTRTMHDTQIEHVKLLMMADIYEAKYIYKYETVTESWTEGNVRITETKEVVKNIIEQGPYYERLLNLMKEHGLNEKSLEMILELATVYDPDYQHSLDTRWAEINSLALDYTQSYYEGELGTIVWPLPGRYNTISSNFGWRIHPIERKYKFHTGIDLPAPSGTAVYAIADGYVRFSGSNKGYGQFIIIEHGDSIYTAYAHLSKRLVKTGELVSRGQEIGTVGSTGLSTGPHLHFEARKVVNGAVNYFNPMELFK